MKHCFKQLHCFCIFTFIAECVDIINFVLVILLNRFQTPTLGAVVLFSFDHVAIVLRSQKKQLDDEELHKLRLFLLIVQRPKYVFKDRDQAFVVESNLFIYLLLIEFTAVVAYLEHLQQEIREIDN